MYTRFRTPSRILAVVLAAGALGASGLTTGAASAQDPDQVLQLTEIGKRIVCGGFQGSIVYSWGYVVECWN